MDDYFDCPTSRTAYANTIHCQHHCPPYFAPCLHHHRSWQHSIHYHSLWRSLPCWGRRSSPNPPTSQQHPWLPHSLWRQRHTRRPWRLRPPLLPQSPYLSMILPPRNSPTRMAPKHSPNILITPIKAWPLSAAWVKASLDMASLST